MKHSLEIMKSANIYPRLRIMKKDSGGIARSTGKHYVKVIADKPIKLFSRKQNKEVDGIRYLFEKDGEKCIYEKEIHNQNGDISYFVLRMAEVSEGASIGLEAKKSGMKSYIEITEGTQTTKAEADDDSETED